MGEPGRAGPAGAHEGGAAAGAGPAYGVVVLAGGSAARLGAVDKAVLDVGGRSVLARLLAPLGAGGAPLVVVGPPRTLPDGLDRAVTWAREDPPGGGPAAGLAAGLAALARTRGRPAPGVAAVVAGDLPFAAAAVPRLVAALAADEDVDAVVGVDPGGRVQQLLAAYRVAPLRAVLAAGPGGAGAAGRSVRSVLTALRVGSLPLAGHECLDVDTPADLARARGLAPAVDGGTATGA